MNIPIIEYLVFMAFGSLSMFFHTFHASKPIPFVVYLGPNQDKKHVWLSNPASFMNLFNKTSFCHKTFKKGLNGGLWNFKLPFL